MMYVARATLMIGLVYATHARADAWKPELVALGHLSAGGPFGDAGLELEVVPLRWLSIAVGGGSVRALPLANSGSYSVGGAARLRYPLGAGWTLQAGLGYSRSDWTAQDVGLGESPYSATQWRSVSYTDLEVGLEHEWRNHLVLRMYVGKGNVLSERGYSCQVLRSEGSCSPPMIPPGTPYTGVAFGYAFSL